MKNILVVDDEKCIRTALSMMLSSVVKDCTIYTAENGAVAAGLFDVLPVHAIVCDISMPVMNGFEFMAHVRARSRGIPIIAMSGYCGKDVQDRLSSLGISRLLEKPFDFEKAAREVGAALQTAGSHRKSALAHAEVGAFVC